MTRTRSTRMLGAAVLAAAFFYLPSTLAEEAPVPATPAEASPWALPAPGSCAPEGGLARGPFSQDAAPKLAVPAGQRAGFEDLPRLRPFLPPEVWEQRDRLFYPGMELEIGACFRDYSPPGFFREASDALGGQAKLTLQGGLSGYTAGLPFAPENIARDDPAAGMKWAWNVQERYRAGGTRGEFRIEDVFGRGRADTFEGTLVQVRVSGRADRADQDYRVGDGEQLWRAAGKLRAPYDVRDFAWRQYRPADGRVQLDRSDELHVWVPVLRKTRRIPAGELEGLYTPTARVGVSSPPDEKEAPAGEGASHPNEIEPKRSGFEGLELRPLLYTFQVLGVHDVLAPINAERAAFPADPVRGFGPHALSWASDRWELRRALVLEGDRRKASTSDETQRPRMRLWVDLQTLHPLYYISFDASGALADVGQFVGRWSEDRDDYPHWPDAADRPVRVIDPAGATFLNLSLGSAWRRESWNMVAVPEADKKSLRDTSLQTLQRGR